MPDSIQKQNIPLNKILDFPGLAFGKFSDKSLGGLVSSLQSKGIEEPLIVRQGKDGEYELIAGYRRRRAGELAKLSDVPAYVVELDDKQAKECYWWSNSGSSETLEAFIKRLKERDTEPEKETSTVPEKENKPVEKSDSSAGDKAESAAPAAAAAAPSKASENEKAEKKKAAAKKPEKAAEENPVNTPAGIAAAGPAGMSISKVLENKLNPPSKKDIKALPVPKDGETYFVVLHPGYLEKSKFNNFSVDRESENYKELEKSIEANGIKDPIIARPKEGGGYEIISGQRRHDIARRLNFPVPTIVQQMDDDDAKILVADGNLHRDKLSSYDLSRALRMKMDAMKHKSGRRKKGDIGPKIDSNEVLAREMGMSYAKFNRMLRLAEAEKVICDKVDDGTMPLSIASAISFLKPENQIKVSDLMDINYKVSTERIERVKKAEKSGALDDNMLRDILEDKDIAPKVAEAPEIPAPSPVVSAFEQTQPTAPERQEPEASPKIVPFTPDEHIPDAVEIHPPVTDAPAPDKTPEAAKSAEPADDVFKGDQERPQYTKVILAGDRLRKYFPDVSMTPREIEDSVYDALEERRQRQEKQRQKDDIFKHAASKAK